MILTEKEARVKRCYRFANSNITCIGPNCMAWKRVWGGKFTPLKVPMEDQKPDEFITVDEQYMLYLIQGGKEKDYVLLGGYCGAANG